MTDSESNKKRAKGFAGLSSMVSDVSEDAARAPAAPEATPRVSQATESLPLQYPASAKPKPAQAELSPAARSSKTGLAWIAAGIAVFVIWMTSSGSGDSSQPPLTQSQPATTFLPDAAIGAATNADLATSDEQVPPVGRNIVLGIAQIRWCKREKIRINAIENVINNAYEREVGIFNARIDDYNSRCAEFRYRQGQVEQVERELATQQESIASTSKTEWIQARAGTSAPLVAERNDEPVPFTIGQSHGERPEPAASQMFLSDDEQQSIDSACADQKTLNGEAAYEKCASKKKSTLASGPRHIDLTGLSAPERESIESACSAQKILQGPAEFNACLLRKLSSLKAGVRNIDLSALSQSEQESMESACSAPKLLEGPAAYNRCLSKKLASLKAGPRNVDLSNLSDARRESIESACSGQKLLEGPAAYNRCLTQKLGPQRNE